MPNINSRKIIFPATVIIISVIYLSFFRIYKFNGDTMNKTVTDKSFVIINKHKKIKSGDIVLFKGFDGKTQLKRIVGVSSDTLQIIKGNLYRNSKKIIYKTQTEKYRISSYNDSITKILIKKLNLKNTDQKQNYFTAELTVAEVKEIMKHPKVYIKRITAEPSFSDKKLFFKGQNAQNIKKFVVPFKNQNYYFLLNDNRNNYNDSRYFGFIPQKNIIGVATYVF